MNKGLNHSDRHNLLYRFINRCGLQCRTDEERIKLALKIIVRNPAVLFVSECKQKDSKHSTSLRDNGDRDFTACTYYDAVKKYTQSIVYAVDSSEELALAYAHRSAALFKLKKYAECITDIERALNQKCSDKLKTKTKLYKRKGLCLISLDRPGADAAFKEALVWLEKMDLSEGDMNRTRRELEKLISDPGKASKPTRNVMKYLLPVIVTPSPEIPSASDAVAIKYSKNFGRHLVATRKIKPGEILILEKPYCLEMFPRCIYSHCSHCLLTSWNLIPCLSCVNAAFCSEACRDKAWDEYHEVECPVVERLRCVQLMNGPPLSLRIVIMATRKGLKLNELREELRNVNRNTDPRTKGYSDDGKFHSDQYRSIYSLSDNVNKCSTEDLCIRSLWVAQTVCMLARETTMFGKKLSLDTLTKNPDVIYVGGLMLKHVNAILINTQSFGASVSQSEHGNAVLAVSNLLNHSCDPNTLRQWYANHMATYAAYPIEQGEQIFTMSGYFWDHKSEKGQRRSSLKVRFDFTCKCRPCIENWPMLLRDLPSYKGQAITQQDKSKLDKVMQKYRASNSSIQKGIIENSPDVLDQLLETIKRLFQLAQRPCVELSMAVSMLKDYYAAADVMFDYEPVSFSELVESRSLYYLTMQLQLSRHPDNITESGTWNQIGSDSRTKVKTTKNRTDNLASHVAPKPCNKNVTYQVRPPPRDAHLIADVVHRTTEAHLSAKGMCFIAPSVYNLMYDCTVAASRRKPGGQEAVRELGKKNNKKKKSGNSKNGQGGQGKVRQFENWSWRSGKSQGIFKRVREFYGNTKKTE